MKKIKNIISLTLTILFCIFIGNFILKGTIQEDENKNASQEGNMVKEKKQNVSAEDSERKDKTEDVLDKEDKTKDAAEKENISAENSEKKDEDLWAKIAAYYIEGTEIYEVGEKAVYKGSEYQVLDVGITKKKHKKWDAVPDFTEYKYDKDFNLKNEYSYVYVKIKIHYIEENMDPELYLNSIGLNVFNDKGEIVTGSELGTTSMGKKESKSYFRCIMDSEKPLETDLVYIVEDKELSKDNIFILSANRGGVKPQEKGDVCLLKLPLGIEVKK